MLTITERRRRRVGAAVGALERRDPIPPGVYWFDSIDSSAYEDSDVVEAARDGYSIAIHTGQPGCLNVLQVVHHEAQLVGNAPARDWVLIEVLCPIPRWPTATQWGLPTIAPNGRETEEGDTVQRPPPEPGPLDFLGGETFGLPTWAVWAGGFAALGVVVYAASR